MDYVLFTSFATYWHPTKRRYEGPTVEIVYYPNAGDCSVMNDVFGPDDSFTSLAYWLGADAETINRQHSVLRGAARRGA